MEDNKKKRGRPVKDGARRNKVGTFVNDDELTRLRNISKRSGMSQMHIMRMGMSMIINSLEEAYPEENIIPDISDEDFFNYDIYDSYVDGFEEDMDDEEL